MRYDDGRRQWRSRRAEQLKTQNTDPGEHEKVSRLLSDCKMHHQANGSLRCAFQGLLVYTGFSKIEKRQVAPPPVPSWTWLFAGAFAFDERNSRPSANVNQTRVSNRCRSTIVSDDIFRRSGFASCACPACSLSLIWRHESNAEKN